ncbi:MAG: SDR family oxidoreductase [Gammaproteobacteria bacterium]|nr:SDR family oxidoreductase [Gammaproteobacteria bacterium]
MTQLKGQVAVVTGAGSGIGQALAQALANEGCRLAISDINETGLEVTLQRILEANPNAKVVTQKLDVADRESVLQYAKALHDELGEINMVINNAGVALSSGVDEVKREDFEWLVNINFWGVVNGCEAFLPYLKQAKSSHLINISSVFGMIAVPRQSSYNAAKFAVRGYTEALRQEMRLNFPHVEVSCVHPGGIATEIARNARVSENENKEELAASFDKLAHTTPQKAASIIVAGIKKNKPRIMVGWDAHVIHFLYRLLGIRYQGLTQLLAKKMDYQ